MDPLLQNLVDSFTAETIIQSLKKIQEEPDDVKYRSEELRDIILQKRALVSKILAEEQHLMKTQQSDIPDRLAGAFGEFFLWLMPHQEQRKEEGIRGQKLCMSQNIADFMAKTLLPYAASADSVYFLSRSICRLTYDEKTARKYCTSRQIMDILVGAFPKAKSDRSLEFLVSALNNITLHNSEATKLLMNQKCADGFVQALEEVAPESDGVEWVGRALYNIVSHAEDDDDEVTAMSSSAFSRTNSTTSSSKGYYQHQKEVCYCTPKMLRALINALRLRTKSAGSIEYIADCITEVMSPTSSCENEEMKEIFENEECVALLFSQLDRVADMHDQCIYGVMNALGAISRSSKVVAKLIAENERYMNRIIATIKEATVPYILQVFSTIICNVTHHFAASAEFFSKEENIEVLMRALELSLVEPQSNSSVALVLNNLTSLSKEAVKSISNPKWEAMLLKSLKEFSDCESDTGVERIACVLTNVTRTDSEFAARLGSSQEAIRIICAAFALSWDDEDDDDDDTDATNHEVASFSSSSPSSRAEYWLDVVVNNIVTNNPTSISSFATFDPRVTRVEVEILRAKSLEELMKQNFLMSSVTQIGKLPRYRLWTLLVRKCSQLLEAEFEQDQNEDNVDFPEGCYLVKLMRFLDAKIIGMNNQNWINEEYIDFFVFSVLPRASRTSSATLLLTQFAQQWKTDVSTKSVSKAAISVLLQILRNGYGESDEFKLVFAILDILLSIQVEEHHMEVRKDSDLAKEMKDALEEARRRGGDRTKAAIDNFEWGLADGEDTLTSTSSTSDEYDNLQVLEGDE